MPLQFRLMIASAVGTAGAIAGIVIYWLRRRGLQQLNDDRLAAAEREETLWAQHEIAEGSLGDKEQEWKKWLKTAAPGGPSSTTGDRGSPHSASSFAAVEPVRL